MLKSISLIKYNIDQNAENVVNTNNSMLNLYNIIDQAESPIENNFEENNMETTNEEKNEILHLSLSIILIVLKTEGLPTAAINISTKRKKIY